MPIPVTMSEPLTIPKVFHFAVSAFASISLWGMLGLHIFHTTGYLVFSTTYCLRSQQVLVRMISSTQTSLARLGETMLTSHVKGKKRG